MREEPIDFYQYPQQGSLVYFWSYYVDQRLCLAVPPTCYLQRHAALSNRGRLERKILALGHTYWGGCRRNPVGMRSRIYVAISILGRKVLAMDIPFAQYCLLYKEMECVYSVFCSRIRDGNCSQTRIIVTQVCKFHMERGFAIPIPQWMLV